MGESIELKVSVDSYGADDDHPSYAVDVDNSGWDDHDNQQREAALFLVAETLTNLLDRLDDWVPRSFVAASKNRLDITISLDLIDIDNAVVLKANEADSELARALRRLHEMEIDLNG
jgi:DNA recombination-dependent growth factor C